MVGEDKKPQLFELAFAEQLPTATCLQKAMEGVCVCLQITTGLQGALPTVLAQEKGKF